MSTAAISSIPPTGVSGTRKPCWKDRSIPSAPSAALKRVGARECKPTLPTRGFRGALLYRDNVVPFRPQTRRGSKRATKGPGGAQLHRDWDGTPDSLDGIMNKRTLTLIAASLVVATGLFWARMLTSPPVTEAATDTGIDVAEIVVPKDLPSFDDTYQRHTGVLDTLK